MNWISGNSILSLLMIFVVGCSGGARQLPCEQDPHCIRYAISADIPILDPHIADLHEAGMIFRQIYDTLVYREGSSHEFVPGLAEAWETSADGLVYTFYLRQGVFFHDGAPLTANSLAANFDRIFNGEIVSRRARTLLGPFSHYEIIDALTFRIHLHSPFAPLLDGLAQPFLGIASEKALGDYDNLRYQFHQAGTGPFELVKYLPGDRVVLHRTNPYANAPAIYRPASAPSIERVEFLLMTGPGATSDMILEGSADVIDDISPGDAAKIANNSRVQLLPTDIPGQVVHFLFNTKRDHIDERDVRRALLYATNRVAIVNNVFYNFSPVAWSPLSRATGYAHTGFVDLFVLDLGIAQELLAAAGYEDSDSDGVLDREGVPLELTVAVPRWGGLPEVADLIRAQWQAIGVKLTIESVPGYGRLSELIRQGETDLVAIDSYGLDPAILGDTFLNESIYGSSRAEDAQLESQLVAALQEQDPVARRNQYYDIQARLMSEALILPIREYVRIRAAGSKIRSLRFDAYGFYPLLYNAEIQDD